MTAKQVKATQLCVSGDVLLGPPCRLTESNTSSVIILPPAPVVIPAQPWWVSAGSLVSAVGIVVSAIALALTRFDRTRDRKLKIDDEFWFQKVAYSQNIEPIFKFYADLPNQLSTTSNDPNFPIYRLQELIEEPARNGRMVSKIYKEIGKKIEDGIAAFEEDALNLIAEGLENGTDYKRELENTCAYARSEIVKAIQDWHKKI